MNKEDYKKWIESLKVGDEVIIKSYGSLSIDTVKKITPKGWIVTNRNGTYWEDKILKRYMLRGGYGTIQPVTEELKQQISIEIRNREEERRKMKVIKEAKDISRNWVSKRNMSYEFACKIIELHKQEE